MLFNVRLTFLTYRRCVSFAAFDSIRIVIFVFASIRVDGKENKNENTYELEFYIYTKVWRGSSVVLYYNKQNRMHLLMANRHILGKTMDADK